ncbi:UAA transporter [Mycena alexandri]|uniref:UAA transporter n=1 Tax=Mycena alexandri TaxID=1745969 RepID=A0AAD6X0U7_9AGAR|nr:UAA transporter [Mycena alexandri]
MFSTIIGDWSTTISLIFGGCCSNAITLEQLTTQYPLSGSLITAFQFLIISLHGIPTHIKWTTYGPRFREHRIPLTPYLVQVALFYLISLLNNAAFSYRIPMSVHIIFRSGGLVISMILGWLISGKRYTFAQVTSVLAVTLGVLLTTLSSSAVNSASSDTDADFSTYLQGIAILTLALLFSGFLGLVQDYTYSRYGRPAPGAPKTADTPTWQESMFFLHFLALPMFFLVQKDITTQLASINVGPRASFPIPLPSSVISALAIPPPFALPFSSVLSSSRPQVEKASHPITLQKTATGLTLAVPRAYLPLLLNTMTQLVCVAGVHRLTTRVSALTVTLVLVVRKAASLVISVWMGRGRGGSAVDLKLMWTGAALVLAGTVGYSAATGRARETKEKKK